MESTLPPAPHSRSAGAKTPESPKNPLQLGCSVTQIRHFFKRTFFNLPLIFENNVKKATVWLHERDEIYRFCKASPFGRCHRRWRRGQARGDRAAYIAIGRLFVRGMLSPRSSFTVSVLALSGASRQLSQRESRRRSGCISLSLSVNLWKMHGLDRDNL